MLLKLKVWLGGLAPPPLGMSLMLRGHLESQFWDVCLILLSFWSKAFIMVFIAALNPADYKMVNRTYTLYEFLVNRSDILVSHVLSAVEKLHKKLVYLSTDIIPLKVYFLQWY